MLRLFSPQHKFSSGGGCGWSWARCQRELGVTRITSEALVEMEAGIDKIDFGAGGRNGRSASGTM